MRPFFPNRNESFLDEGRKNATACNFPKSGNCGDCSPDGGSLLHCTFDKRPGGLFIRAVC
jgi:hypothetical protein